ncbi:unnamed protein product [Peniophora sp. CBMAI 1063]|nr:unnamed protein product [Peniophora sp. CBMAI 1063]
MSAQQVNGRGRVKKVRHPQRATILARYGDRWAETAGSSTPETKRKRVGILNEAEAWVWLTYGTDEPWREIGEEENDALIDAGEWLAADGVVMDVEKSKRSAMRQDICRVLHKTTQNRTTENGTTEDQA